MKRNKMKMKPITYIVTAVLLITAGVICYAACNYNVTEGANGEIIIGAPATTTSRSKYTTGQSSQTSATAKTNSMQTTKTSAAKSTAKQENNMTINQSVLNSYLNKNNTFFKKYKFPTSVSTIQITSLLTAQSGGFHANTVELPWYNGNYIVWNTGMANKTFYSAEYDSQQFEAGFFVIEKPNSENNFYICYEYRDGAYEQNLKSIFIYYKDSHRAAFLYDANKNLIMYQLDGANKIEKPSLIKNSQFMSEIAAIFDNPDAAVKAGKKFSPQPQQITKKKYNYTLEMDNLNYLASTFSMDRIQAINGYYWAFTDNTPIKLKLYDMMVKNSQYTYDQIDFTIKHADEYPASFYKVIEKGIIPDYMKPTMMIGYKEDLMNSLVDVFDMMKANKFSKQDIKNIVWYYCYIMYEDEQTISKADAQSIMNNSSLSSKDKYYHLYAKLAAKHLNDPNVETDILNSYALLKQHPELVQSGFDNSILKDETLRLLHYYAEGCKTERAIKTVLAQNNIPNKERFYKIIGQLKAQAFIDSGKEYPETYYEIAREGILDFGFTKQKCNRYHQNIYDKYKYDDVVLEDVLSAAKLLMKNRYYDWNSGFYDDDNDIFLIAPDLHITTKVVSEVLNDSSIPYDKKETTIASLLYEAYYQNEDKSLKDCDRLSATSYKLIEKGYYSKYMNNLTEKGYGNFSEGRNNIDLRNINDDSAKYLSIIDLMVKNGLSDDDIRILITAIYRGRIVENADKILFPILNNKTYTSKEKAKKAYKELYLACLGRKSQESESARQQMINRAAKLLDNNIIAMNIQQANRFSFIASDYYDIDEKNMNALIALKKTPGFKDRDRDAIYKDSTRLQYLSFALNKVLNDSSIKVEDRPAFVASLAEREYYKAKVSKQALSVDLLNKALDKGLWVYSYPPPRKWVNDTALNKSLELYIRLRDELRFEGDDIVEVFNAMGDWYDDRVTSAALNAANKFNATKESIKNAILNASNS